MSKPQTDKPQATTQTTQTQHTRKPPNQTTETQTTGDTQGNYSYRQTTSKPQPKHEQATDRQATSNHSKPHRQTTVCHTSNPQPPTNQNHRKQTKCRPQAKQHTQETTGTTAGNKTNTKAMKKQNTGRHHRTTTGTLQTTDKSFETCSRQSCCCKCGSKSQKEMTES